jgi:hypothetical protein
MASKVWDDLSMWNVDFSQVYSNFDLARINALELAMLEALKYVIRVSASEYAKYYFLLRSMSLRLGLVGGSSGSTGSGSSSGSTGNPANTFLTSRPLDLAGAKKLQLSTERYQELSSFAPTTRPRHNSMHDGGAITATVKGEGGSGGSGASGSGIRGGGPGGPPSLDRNRSDGYPLRVKHSTVSVGLEQLIHNEHVDADGQVHTSLSHQGSMKKRGSGSHGSTKVSPMKRAEEK